MGKENLKVILHAVALQFLPGPKNSIDFLQKSEDCYQFCSFLRVLEGKGLDIRRLWPQIPVFEDSKSGFFSHRSRRQGTGHLGTLASSFSF